MSRRYSLSAFMLLVLFLTVISSGCKGRFVPMDLDDASMAWADYEGAVYDFLINDVKQAENIMTVEKIDESNYKIDLFMEIYGGQHVVGAVVNGETFTPVSSYNRMLPPPAEESKKRESFAVYEGQKLNITAHRDGKEQRFSIKLPRMVVDNESALMLVRNLPLNEGYKKLLNLAIIATVQVAPYEIRVEAQEAIQVPYGEVECYKVVYAYKGIGSVPDMYAWYSADDAKILVKYINQNVTFELTSFESYYRLQTQ